MLLPLKITDIKQQQKQADRYSVFVDGKYIFSLSEAALLEQQLFSGMELSKKQVSDYKKLSADDKLYNNALRYSAMRARSHWELEIYLRRKKAEEPIARHIIEKLEGLSLLNDTEFARSWLANRRLLKPMSMRQLTQELRQKRVPSAVIELVLSEDETDERSVLQTLIGKKKQQYPDQTKLMQYLARHGFSYDDIKYALQAEAEAEAEV
jgi:regulatory protein